MKYICALLVYMILIVGCSSVYEEVNADLETSEMLVSKEEQQERFEVFYDQVFKLVNFLKDLDGTITKLEDQNPAKLQLYEYFKKFKGLMEDGQNQPLGSLVPEGFNQIQEEQMSDITTNMDRTFQYRKFAYDHFLQYIDTGSIKSADESKEWLKSAHNSLQSAITNLELIKLELGIVADSSQNTDSSKEDSVTNSQNIDVINPSYEVVYTLTTKRFDKGVNYYILIEPVDLSTPSFCSQPSSMTLYTSS